MEKILRVFIIAEAGVNHNGNIDVAKKMIDTAKFVGADAVKFQTFNSQKLATNTAPKADYQKSQTDKEESQLQMLEKLALSHEEQKQLFQYATSQEIEFLSSPFDLESIDFLGDLSLNCIKIPSGEITNLPYLRKIGQLGKRIILSTGMSDMDEIHQALDILVSSGTKKDNIIVLHCTTAYPTSYEDVNLLAMISIGEKFNISVGYSDHTIGIEIPIAAVALGAVVIEKHFTLSRDMEGPDHKASLEPQELKEMVEAIRNIERALGDGIKKATLSEEGNKLVARKSIVAMKNIKRGDIFSEDNITVKRPGIGLSPMKWDSVIDQIAKKDFIVDEIIEI